MSVLPIISLDIFAMKYMITSHLTPIHKDGAVTVKSREKYYYEKIGFRLEPKWAGKWGCITKVSIQFK